MRRTGSHQRLVLASKGAGIAAVASRIAAVALGIAAVAVAIVVSWVPSAAFGYVRTTSDRSGVPVQWLERCIIVRPDGRGSQDLSLDEIQGALARSVENWTSKTLSCTQLLLQSAPPTAAGDFGIDSRPTLIFRDKSWVRPGTNMPRDTGIIALTTVFYVDTPGFVGDATILDADIELNGVSYTFTTNLGSSVAREGTELADLENTLTHELGHVQGLGHTCWDHVRSSPPLDDRGQPIPDCRGTVPQDVLDTTMYPYPLSAGETSKRRLAQDDIDGVCQTYTTTSAPLTCHQEIDGGCDILPHPSSTGAPGVGLLLLALWGLRRRRRRA
jgi:hypothetical protein